MIFNIFRKLVGVRPVDYVSLVKNGAIIVDVRTKQEFEKGSIKDSVNIPLDQLKRNLHLLPDKQQPVILCCASGVRSSSAKTILAAGGYSKVFNGGSWSALESRIR